MGAYHCIPAALITFLVGLAPGPGYLFMTVIALVQKSGLGWARHALRITLHDSEVGEGLIVIGLPSKWQMISIYDWRAQQNTLTGSV
jgi:hypothetical protein